MKSNQSCNHIITINHEYSGNGTLYEVCYFQHRMIMLGCYWHDVLAIFFASSSCLGLLIVFLHNIAIQKTQFGVISKIPFLI